MDAPLVLYQHLLLSTTCQQCRRARWIKAPGPGMAGTHGVTWKKRDHPSENHSHTHTHICTIRPPAYTFRKREKRQWKVPRFLNFLYFLYSRPESHKSQSCVNKILGSLFQYYAQFLQINIARLLSNVKECVPNEICKQRRILCCWIF